MNLAIQKTRQLNEDEIKSLSKRVRDLWAERANSAVRVSTSYVKAGAWMAANGFTKLVNKTTDANVTDQFKKDAGLGAAFTIGALIATPILPMLPLGITAATIGAVTAGTYVTGKVTQALHNLTDKKLDALKENGEEALKVAEQAGNAYNSLDADYALEKGKLEKAKAAKREAFKEEIKEGWKDFNAGAQEDWVATKEEIKARANKIKQGFAAGVGKVKEGVNAGVDKVKAGVNAGVDKVKTGVNTVVDGVNAGVDKVKTGVIAGANKVKAGAKVVADTAQLILDKDAREEAIARTKREHEYSDKAIARDNARIQREAEREARRQAQAEARQERIAERERQQAIIARAESINKATKKAEKVAAKEARDAARSKKALKFLDETKSCLGTAWIADHLLTQEDKNKYLSAMAAQAEVAELKQADERKRLEAERDAERKRVEAGIKIAKEMDYIAGDYSFADYEAMSEKQRAKFIQKLEDAQYYAKKKKEDDLTV